MALRSMTGYGRGECFLNDRKCIVEIKSVNHRYSDLSIKLPRSLNSLEDSLRKQLSAKILRGKVDVYVTFESFSSDDIRITANIALADAYVAEMRKLAERYGLTDDMELSLLTRLPDVFSVEKSAQEDKNMSEIRELLTQSAAEACGQFTKMRESEGLALKQDILKRKELIYELVERVKERAPLVANDYSERLKQRLAEAAAETVIDPARLATEIMLFADRACIDEEITRMRSHLSQLEDILISGGEENGAVGRKLDFLVQEMNREANTMGSKSNDLEITKYVVDLKSEIEKIREQIQNIE